MKRIQNYRLYIFLYISAFVVIFIALINLNRTYKSEVEIMLIARNEATAKNMDRILEDAREIALTLSFYDRMVENGIEDPVEELPGYKRQAYWNDKVRTEKVDGSNMVRITIFDKDQLIADEISQQAALSTAETLSQYYDIKTELDTRIADGPTISYGSKNNVFILLLQSIWGSALFVLVVALVNGLLEFAGFGTKTGKKESQVMKYSIPQIRKIIEEKPITFDKKPTDFKIPQQKNIEVEKTAPIIETGKKSAAPENLPIADESMFQSVAPKTEPKKEEQLAEKPIIREATPEEVKERLNKLLSGGF
jgi:hypothetical protein